jgi:hypothetical protein
LTLFISLYLVCCGNVAYAGDNPQKVAATVHLIKVVSQEEVADADSPIVIKPFFIMGKKDNVSWIDYDLGGVAVDNMGLPPEDPYRLPYVMQIQVEALRKVFEENAGQKNFWRSHLDNAERLVRLTVEDIESTPDRKKLDVKLSERSKAFQTVLGALEESIRTYAKSKKLQIGEPRVGLRLRFGEPEPYSVQVLTEPDGGKVRVVTAFVWRTCVKKGCNKDQLVWRRLNIGGTEGLIGGYHYIAEWGDGGKDEDDMKIDGDQERKFRPFRRQ